MNPQGASEIKKPGTIQEFLKAVDQSMKAEGVPDAVRDRVIKRLLWGAPEGQGPGAGSADPGQMWVPV